MTIPFHFPRVGVIARNWFTNDAPSKSTSLALLPDALELLLLVGIFSFCPTWIELASRKPLAETILETLVPCLCAIMLSESPRFTAYVIELFSGMVNRFPGRMRLGFLMLFALIIASFVTPYRRAILLNVSPLFTT